MAKKNKFNGLLSSQFKRPNKWKLTKSLTFKTDLWKEEIDLFKKNKVDIKWDKDIMTVPKGYITDMASVPRAAWAFIAPFDVARAAVCHDIMYEKLNARRKHINTKEFKAMRAIADTVALAVIVRPAIVRDWPFVNASNVTTCVSPDLGSTPSRPVPDAAVI